VTTGANRSRCSEKRCCRISVEIDPAAFDAFESAGWERCAREYEHFWADLTAQLIAPLLDAAGVGAGMKVLDLATGPGYVAARAAERGALPVGIDVASSMVELSRELHPTLEFRQASVIELPFEEETFDAVVGNFMILHVGEPERAASEAARVLKPGGPIALSTWDVPERAMIFGVILGAIEDAGAAPPAEVPPGPPFFRFSNDSEFRSLLRDAAFESVNVQTVDFRHAFSSGAVVWEGIVEGTVRTRALLAGQSDEVRRQIRRAFDERMRAYQSNGRIELPISVRIASGRKASA
jgi:SAM-dependent methyltransferase